MQKATHSPHLLTLAALPVLLAAAFLYRVHAVPNRDGLGPVAATVASQRNAVAHDISPPLALMAPAEDRDAVAEMEKDSDADVDDPVRPTNILAPGSAEQDAVKGAASSNAQAVVVIPPQSAAVEQTKHGTRPAPGILASFDGLGDGFIGPQGTSRQRNPSDNSLAVGPDHIVQIINTRMAVFTKRGSKFKTTGQALYGPVETRNVFKGFGDAGQINNGDAVVRYDQLADRWLIVMPIFRRLPPRENEPVAGKSGEPARLSQPGVRGQPGGAATVVQPPPPTPAEITAAEARRGQRRGGGGGGGRGTNAPRGSYAMCYAVSTSPDPLGSYYRYEFIRPLFPDYPRPAVWPDGYYVPTSSGDTVIQKQAFVVDRNKMLKGEDASEQGIIVDGVNFLNNADLDGKRLPPAGSPNIVMAAGGTQLKHILEDDGVYYWKFHVDWSDPSKTRLDGPVKIPVAPYHYLGGGQLSDAVPQPGTARRLDSQGDKIMSRLVYRRNGSRESIVAVHSISTSAGGGGVRWYEFRLDKQRDASLYQQGTYAPGGDFRWLPSPAIDSGGNIGIGYSFGGTNDFPGQRFAGRLYGDPLGMLTLHEAVLAEGHASQKYGQRWEDYSQTAVDPSDDRTIWYVGDYYKPGATNYSTRIGAFRLVADNGRHNGVRP